MERRRTFLYLGTYILAKRNTVVKNPKKGRDTSPTESEKTGSVSPFGKKY